MCDRGEGELISGGEYDAMGYIRDVVVVPYSAAVGQKNTVHDLLEGTDILAVCSDSGNVSLV